MNFVSTILQKERKVMHSFINQPVSLHFETFQKVFELSMKGQSTQEILKTFGMKVEPEQINSSNALFSSFTDALKNALSGSSGEGKYVSLITAGGIMTRFSSYYNYGYEDIARQLLKADADPNSLGTVFRAVGPGGTSDGNYLVPDAINACKKPVVAATNYAMSATYMMICPCDEIVMDAGAASQVGSIGSQYVHVNESKYFENQGIEHKIIRATGSEMKNQVNSIEPLSEDAQAKIQTLVDSCRKEFVGYVLRGRAGRNLKNEALTGDEFSAKVALNLGLIDRLGSLEVAIQRVVQLSSK